MMAALPLQLSRHDGILTPKRLDETLRKSSRPLRLGMPALDEALPDGGLPTGAVVELCAPSGLGRATHLALRVCAAAQRMSPTGASCDWAAWVDPSTTAGASSLFAPALVRAGVDLERLLVVQPPPEEIARVAVRLATSRLFRAIIVDRSGLPGASTSDRIRWSTVVRRLALTAESSESTIVLLSATARAHRDLLPTAMRIELTRPHHGELRVHVTKDRRGHLPGPVSVPVSALRRPRAA